MTLKEVIKVVDQIEDTEEVLALEIFGRHFEDLDDDDREYITCEVYERM